MPESLPKMDCSRWGISHAALSKMKTCSIGFRKNAELLIDHAWGFEPCTVPEIKAYKPETNSISSGQVLHCPYETDKAKLVLKEMADQLALDLVNKKS